jgi:hypothetical protein
MATFYGALVGTPKNATPPTPVPNTLENGKDSIIVRDRIELSAAAIGDLIELARDVPWETVIDPYNSDFSFDDLGTSVTMSIGDGGTYFNALCSAQDVATAAGTAKICKSVDIANYYKPLWQVLGYSTLAAAKAVAASCDIYAKIAGGAATGTFVWQIRGQRRMA